MNPKTWKPCNNRILIQLFKPEKSGVLIPETSKFSAPIGAEDRGYILVLAVADGVTCCKPDDKIVLNPHANILCVDKEEEIHLADASVVLAIEFEAPTL